ncbi:MAG: methylenetetrahydrofolate reductase, partial [Gammaproteobacteria bacterium]|nr:methylenetetrahydrofolate reductase [Gammaproteobacteria bacterium]
MTSSTSTRFSFEFFPPKSAEGMEKLRATVTGLQQFAPEYVSVTFGAGGSTQQGTRDTVQALMALGLEVAPHLSCIGSGRDLLRTILDDYRQMGVRRLVALRGDMPSGMRDTGDFHYANELVQFIREESGDHFHLEVAAYPEFHPQASSAS